MHTIELRSLITVLEVCLGRKVTLEEVAVKSEVTLFSLKRLSSHKEVNITVKNLFKLAAFFTQEFRPFIESTVSEREIIYSVLTTLLNVGPEYNGKPFSETYLASGDLVSVFLKDRISKVFSSKNNKKK